MVDNTEADVKCAAPVEQVIDWNKELRDDEVGQDNGTKFVYLKGLQRLIEQRGVKSERQFFGNVVVLKRHDSGVEYPFVQMGFEIELKDGTKYSDVADAHTYNVDGVFSAYPSAIAASRARARTYRRALNISMVSKEELGADPEKIADLRNEITSAQKKVIKTLMTTRGVANQMDVIKHISKRDDIVDISELTFEEAKAAVKFLNALKVK